MNNIINIESPPKMMSIKKASEYLGVSEYGLRKGIKDGSIPFMRSGAKYYVAVDALLERIKSNSDN